MTVAEVANIASSTQIVDGQLFDLSDTEIEFVAVSVDSMNDDESKSNK